MRARGVLVPEPFLFNAGWALAVTFLLVAAATALYSARTNEVLLNTNEALQKENTILYQQMDAQREELAALSARAAVTPPAEKGADKAVAAPNAAPETRRAANESTRRPPPRRAP